MSRTSRAPLLAAVVGVCAATFAAPGAIRGQAPASIAANYKLDFAVPDAPAFTVLEPGPSEILRPATVRDLTLAASDFLSETSGLAIPAAFAAEFSPGLLIGGRRLSLQRYRATPWLYRLRVSVATGRDASGSAPTRMALGVRLPLVDGADLRTSAAGREYARQLTGLAEDMVDVRQQVQDELVRVLAQGPDAATAPIVAQEVADALVDAETMAERVAILAEGAGLSEVEAEAFLDWFTSAPLRRTGELAEREERLKHLRKALEEGTWNETVLEVAAAALGEAADSTGRGLTDTRYALWGTGGLGLGRWGQLLVGLQGAWERQPESRRFDGTGSLAARVYAGSNWLKGFVEASGSVSDREKPRWLLNGGGEVRPVRGFWATFSAGVEFDRETGEANSRSSVAFKLGLFNS